MRATVLAVVLAACGTPDDGLRIAGATPAFGALVGGTQITITGAGFTAGVRALIGGREAPLVTATSDAALAIVIPPGDHPGDAEIVVFDDNHAAHATGMFHYSTPPAVTAVTPGDVLYSTSTRITVTGSGFLDEAAGETVAIVGGQPTFDIQVRSDTELTFFTAQGNPLAQPALEVTNRRGTARRAHAFRYTPSEHGGLLLFSTFGADFAVFYDPIDNTVVSIPQVAAPTARITAIVRDEHGDYWALDRARRFGRIDMTTQTLEAPIGTLGWFPAVARVGTEDYAIERASLRFGKLDPVSGGFLPLSAAIPCCGSYGLASDGTTLWFTSRQGAGVTIASIDPTTGVTGTPVAITAGPGFHIEDMRFFGGTLYATSRDGTLVTIDPATGATTVLPVNLGRFNAMEIFE